MSLALSDKNAYHRAWYAKNKDRVKAYKSRGEFHRKHNCKRRGLTIQEYEIMLLAQGGVCAICGKPPNKKRLAIDHDHKTGRNRGLLCWKCNYGLGLWNDDPQRHRNAAEYLERLPLT